ncbi:xanthine dehydrogenase family protein subunit M [Streptomyces sp. TS71-3]|uniref:FAD binding domain-containing protein n=1 Tax=Streptomyces sp. TS71-3 TaxID=2733862 RepID=UPI0024B5F84A|nr:FAD binding domain-containing protein [Streptomyces sp. TS71-3]
MVRVQSWPEAVAVRSEFPDAVPVAGGTDVMVAIKLRNLRPEVLLDLSRIPGSDRYRVGPDTVRLGPRVCHTAVAELLGPHLPGLALAARSVGSRQVRNRGTIGGSLGTASAAGDVHPALLAAGADIELSSVRGARWVPADGFYGHRGGTALAADELITGVRVPRAAGPQRFQKIGLRLGLVKALCSFAIALDRDGRRVRAALGAYGAAPVRARAAERLLEESGALGTARPLPAALVTEFGRLAATSATPVEGGGVGADYRRRAVSVLAARNLVQVWDTFLAKGHHGHHRDGQRQAP